VRPAIGPITNDRRKRSTGVTRTQNVKFTEKRLGVARHIRLQSRRPY
jgi:hypothetical protein